MFPSIRVTLFISGYIRMMSVVSAAALMGCTSLPSLPQQDHEITTYYDRNHDGVVDFELHETPAMADASWALSDTKFDGRYDVRLRFGYVFSRERIDEPVPKNVSITKDKPSVFTTQ